MLNERDEVTGINWFERLYNETQQLRIDFARLESTVQKSLTDNSRVEKQIEVLSDRVSNLEQIQWQMTGIGSFVVFALPVLMTLMTGWVREKVRNGRKT